VWEYKKTKRGIFNQDRNGSVIARKAGTGRTIEMLRRAEKSSRMISKKVPKSRNLFK